jgi:Lhr-like helicase
MHEYYFSFAEIQYSGKQNRFEVSITCTGHDLESAIKDKGIEIPKFEECIENPIHLKKIEKVLQEDFKVYADEKPILFELIGMEVNTKDQAIFYLTSREMKKPSGFDVEYKLLMDYYPTQQNKLTVFTPSGKEYLTFLKSRKKRKFEY